MFVTVFINVFEERYSKQIAVRKLYTSLACLVWIHRRYVGLSRTERP